MNDSAPSPQTTLVILLGASQWPYSPEFNGSVAFVNVARDFREYILHPHQFGLPKQNFLDLFDTDQGPDKIDKSMREFLDERTSLMKLVGRTPRDLLFYFVGHGGFVGRNSEYYLAVRSTSTENARVSGLPIEALATTLTDKARYFRRLIILDCCYAAAAFSAFQAEGPTIAAIRQTVDAFKERAKSVGKGTSLLCSSGKKVTSSFVPDRSYTMFSRALLQVLSKTGHRRRPDIAYLSLHEVADLTEEVLLNLPDGMAPRPELHSPDQYDGVVADVPFFPNIARKISRGRTDECDLDQLWFTWSTAGLGAMQAGFRVRAASEGLHELQSMRYRYVNRFLSYEMPEGAPISDLDSRVAPVTLALVDTQGERLLIRKVFLGKDAYGRNGVFFTHLIAGLPPDFTARDAIRLWDCPELWSESEHDLSPNDTNLPKIPYSRILSYVERAQTEFSFTPIREQLQNLLLLILQHGLPLHIRIKGHTTLIAALIYGMTHTLPQSLILNLTFTTYERQGWEEEPTVITGTISGAELYNTTSIAIQPGLVNGSVSDDLRDYVTFAVNSLVMSNTGDLFRIIGEFERHGHSRVEDLIELFKSHLHPEKFTFRQLEDIFLLYPANNLDYLLDPDFQKEAAQLLLKNPDYWEHHGKQVFKTVASWIAPGVRTRLDQQTIEGLARGINGIADQICASLQAEIWQGKVPPHGMDILVVLADPSYYPDIYQRLLTKFPQSISDQLWPFHLWLLSRAKLMQPLPTLETIRPWLHISAWDKLDAVLKLELPITWQYQAIFELLHLNREIPQRAIKVIQEHETKFTAFMQDLLRRGSQMKNHDYINMVLRLFTTIIRFDEMARTAHQPEYSYHHRADLLLELLKAVPGDQVLIESLFSIVPFESPRRLSLPDFDRIVNGCKPEFLLSSGKAPSFKPYLQEYILSLSLRNLNPTVVERLRLFQDPTIAPVANAWLTISTFLAGPVFEPALLYSIKPALELLVPKLQQGRQDVWRTFIEDIVPSLCALVSTEYHLESVLEVFPSTSMFQTWDLLNRMATYEGATQAENLPRLIPYLLCGIREYTRIGVPKDALDVYLPALFSQVSDNALKDIDKAVSTKVWPELIRNEWAGWRKRTKPSWFSNLFKGER